MPQPLQPSGRAKPRRSHHSNHSVHTCCEEAGTLPAGAAPTALTMGSVGPILPVPCAPPCCEPARGWFHCSMRLSRESRFLCRNPLALSAYPACMPAACWHTAVGHASLTDVMQASCNQNKTICLRAWSSSHCGQAQHFFSVLQPQHCTARPSPSPSTWALERTLDHWQAHAVQQAA